MEGVETEAMSKIKDAYSVGAGKSRDSEVVTQAEEEGSRNRCEKSE